MFVSVVGRACWRLLLLDIEWQRGNRGATGRQRGNRAGSVFRIRDGVPNPSCVTFGDVTVESCSGK